MKLLLDLPALELDAVALDNFDFLFDFFFVDDDDVASLSDVIAVDAVVTAFWFALDFLAFLFALASFLVSDLGLSTLEALSEAVAFASVLLLAFKLFLDFLNLKRSVAISAAAFRTKSLDEDGFEVSLDLPAVDWFLDLAADLEKRLLKDFWLANMLVWFEADDDDAIDDGTTRWIPRHTLHCINND